MTNSVAEKIKRLRKSKGFSQEKLAEQLNISQSAYARMENGESNSWIHHLEKLSDIFEIRPEDFLSNDTNIFNNLNQSGGFAFQNVVTIDTINSLSEKLIEQYEARIRNLEEQLEFWKNKN